jgi:hypothetical protein
MKRLALLLVALTFAPVLAGCGGGGSDNALSETASKLGEIESGVLVLRVLVEGTGELEGQAGFELDGPFALAQEGELPVAEIEYRKIAGDESAEATFISTGDRAFVETGGQTYELPHSMVADMRASEEDGQGVEGLDELEIGDWMVEPEVSDGGEVGGAETDRIQSRLDVVAAVNDMLELARRLGAPNLGTLEGAGAEQLRSAVQSSSIDVFTGKEDRLLRRLAIDVEFGATGPPELEQVLGELGGAHLVFDLEIGEPNEPVEVAAPSDSQPFPG